MARGNRTLLMVVLVGVTALAQPAGAASEMASVIMTQEQLHSQPTLKELAISWITSSDNQLNADPSLKEYDPAKLDVNHDGVLDEKDVDKWQAVQVAPQNGPEDDKYLEITFPRTGRRLMLGDVNGDGTQDTDDIAQWLADTYDDCDEGTGSQEGEGKQPHPEQAPPGTPAGGTYSSPLPPPPGGESLSVGRDCSLLYDTNRDINNDGEVNALDHVLLELGIARAYRNNGMVFSVHGRVINPDLKVLAFDGVSVTMSITDPTETESGSVTYGGVEGTWGPFKPDPRDRDYIIIDRRPSCSSNQRRDR